MQVLDILRRHPVSAGMLVGALIGTVVGLFLPIRAPAPGKRQDAAWTLPSLASTRSYDDAAAVSVRNAQYWGAAANAGRTGRTQASWQLQAILTRPSPRIAITMASKSGVVWVPLFGKLPDGSVLVGVQRDLAWIERDGCRSSRKLYATPAELQLDPCEASTSQQSSSASGAPAPASPNP